MRIPIPNQSTSLKNEEKDIVNNNAITTWRHLTMGADTIIVLSCTIIMAFLRTEERTEVAWRGRAIIALL